MIIRDSYRVFNYKCSTQKYYKTKHITIIDI